MNAVEFYLSRPRPLSRADIVKIAMMTTGQRANPDWLKLRNYCLTASNFAGGIAACYFNKDRDKFLRQYLCPSKPTPAMKYGVAKEGAARRAYCETTAMNVRDTGLWLFPSGNLGASPDGLVYEYTDDREPEGLVEFKCPYSMRDKDRHALEEFAEKNQKFHFQQVQGQLAATRLPWCDLVYWSPRGLWKRRIMKDYIWRLINVPLLESFFVDVLQPAKAGMHIVMAFPPVYFRDCVIQDGGRI